MEIFDCDKVTSKKALGGTRLTEALWRLDLDRDRYILSKSLKRDRKNWKDREKARKTSTGESATGRVRSI